MDLLTSVPSPKTTGATTRESPFDGELSKMINKSLPSSERSSILAVLGRHIELFDFASKHRSRNQLPGPRPQHVTHSAHPALQKNPFSPEGATTHIETSVARVRSLHPVFSRFATATASFSLTLRLVIPRVRSDSQLSSLLPLSVLTPTSSTIGTFSWRGSVIVEE